VPRPAVGIVIPASAGMTDSIPDLRNDALNQERASDADQSRRSLQGPIVGSCLLSMIRPLGWSPSEQIA
jgi:hypothetical protein